LKVEKDEKVESIAVYFCPVVMSVGRDDFFSAPLPRIPDFPTPLIPNFGIEAIDSLFLPRRLAACEARQSLFSTHALYPHFYCPFLYYLRHSSRQFSSYAL